MKIKVLVGKKENLSQKGNILFCVSFRIAELDDEEILKISQLSPIIINMNPASCGLTNFQWRPVQLASEKKWVFSLKSDKDGFLNFGDLEDIELTFQNVNDADKYKEFILGQFTNEMNRIKNIDKTLEKEEVYEIKSDEGIKKIYEGVKKLLDKNSEEYKEIIEKNKGAWKKLADL